MQAYQTVNLGDVTLHYAKVRGEEPAVVLLHGITDSSATYLALIAELIDMAHVCTLDLVSMDD